jgi:hypothetical protein
MLFQICHTLNEKRRLEIPEIEAATFNEVNIMRFTTTTNTTTNNNNNNNKIGGQNHKKSIKTKA